MAYFDKKEGSLEEAIKASLTDGSKEEYQKFFNAAMKKFKISSPSELKTDADKKKMKEKKDFAKGSKAATGEPAAKVEIDPKIKD